MATTKWQSTDTVPMDGSWFWALLKGANGTSQVTMMKWVIMEKWALGGKADSIQKGYFDYSDTIIIKGAKIAKWFPLSEPPKF